MNQSYGRRRRQGVRTDGPREVVQLVNYIAGKALFDRVTEAAGCDWRWSEPNQSHGGMLNKTVITFALAAIRQANSVTLESPKT